jgi:hypothetical protein
MPPIETEIHADSPAAPQPSAGCVEYELPTVEAMLAGTLALMTGYSQALQAALHPEQRVLMGSKIGRNMLLLAEHPQLSAAFKSVLRGLQQRWVLMTACTVESEPPGASPAARIH